jgi:serine phosphatase RsbU (regulator of sigma subunit)
LEPGDTVLFYTDGIIEARCATGEQFGRKRLGDMLVRYAAAGTTIAETVRKLCHGVLAHQDGVLQDDATLLLLSWVGPRS